MNDECEFEVTQDGMTVARGVGPHDSAVAEATHYALMYGQDGPVAWKVYRISRTAAGRRNRTQILEGSFESVSIRMSNL